MSCLSLLLLPAAGGKQELGAIEVCVRSLVRYECDGLRTCTGRSMRDIEGRGCSVPLNWLLSSSESRVASALTTGSTYDVSVLLVDNSYTSV